MEKEDKKSKNHQKDEVEKQSFKNLETQSLINRNRAEEDLNLDDNLLNETQCNLIDKENAFEKDLLINKKLLENIRIEKDENTSDFVSLSNQNILKAPKVQIERDPFSDEHLKYLNRVKPIVIDFDNDDWVYDPNLCEIERYEIDKMSNFSERSENCEYSLNQNRNEEEDSFGLQNDFNQNDETKGGILEKDEDEDEKNNSQ